MLPKTAKKLIVRIDGVCSGSGCRQDQFAKGGLNFPPEMCILEDRFYQLYLKIEKS